LSIRATVVTVDVSRRWKCVFSPVEKTPHSRHGFMTVRRQLPMGTLQNERMGDGLVPPSFRLSLPIPRSYRLAYDMGELKRRYANHSTFSFPRFPGNDDADSVGYNDKLQNAPHHRYMR
jgi:hypothetical protein